MSVLKYFSNNSKTVDALEEETSNRSKYPKLLHKDEKIILAFKSFGDMGRDKQYLTSHRILVKDGKGIGHKRRNYLSIPYNKIQSFSFTTAGSFFDTDVEFHFTVKGDIAYSLDFAAAQVDVFALQKFISEKVLLASKEFQTPSTSLPTTENKAQMQGFMDWIGDNAVQLDSASVQNKFTNDYPVLLKGTENVHLAFKTGRDTTIITNKRFFVVDVKGWTGKRIKFESLPWSSVAAFAVETAGHWDRDCELKIYTNIPSNKYITQDLRNGSADLFAVQRAFCDMILGEDNTFMKDVASLVAAKTNIFNWIGDNSRMLDPKEMDAIHHSSPNILQPNEVVEMAFKGRRDFFMFTTKRLISCDKKGLLGKSIEYLSIPWTSVVGFAVQSAGQIIDLDSEMVIYTEIMFDPPQGEDDPPTPGMSMLEFGFNKAAVNILDIQKYLSSRILGQERGVPIPPNMMSAAPPEGALQSILSRLGDDMKAIDARELNVEFHTNAPILIDGEDLVMAFKAGRDMTLLTNKRILTIDTKGLMGKKKCYLSIPYGSIRAFGVESAGSWDRDSELKVYTRNYWDFGSVNLDFRKGKADIIAIQKFVAAMVLKNHEDAKTYFDSAGAPMEASQTLVFGNILDWVNNDSIPEDPVIYEQKLRSQPPLLLSDETVSKVFKAGRDKYIYTNKRLLVIDVKGWSGKRIGYKSYPYKYMSAFAIETAGNLDNDAETWVYTDCAAGAVEQEYLVKSFDIMNMQEYLTQRMFFDEEFAPQEADIDLSV